MKAAESARGGRGSLRRLSSLLLHGRGPVRAGVVFTLKRSGVAVTFETSSGSWWIHFYLRTKEPLLADPAVVLSLYKCPWEWK